MYQTLLPLKTSIRYLRNMCNQSLFQSNQAIDEALLFVNKLYKYLEYNRQDSASFYLGSSSMQKYYGKGAATDSPLPLKIYQLYFDRAMAKQKAESEMYLAKTKSAANLGYYSVLDELRQIRLKNKAVGVDYAYLRDWMSSYFVKLQQCCAAQYYVIADYQKENYQMRYKIRYLYKYLGDAEEELSQSYSIQISKAKMGMSSCANTRMAETYGSPLLSSSHPLSNSLRSTATYDASANRPFSPTYSGDKNAYRLMRENHELTMKNLELYKQLQKCSIREQIYYQVIADTAQQIRSIRIKEPYCLMKYIDELNSKLSGIQRQVPQIACCITGNKMSTIYMVQSVLNVQKLYYPKILSSLAQIEKIANQIRRIEAKVEWFKWK